MSAPLEGLEGRARWVEFAAMRCADMDDIEWAALLPHRKERYREYAEAVSGVLPPHIGGELWQYVENTPPWVKTPRSPKALERSDPEGEQ